MRHQCFSSIGHGIGHMLIWQLFYFLFGFMYMLYFLRLTFFSTALLDASVSCCTQGFDFKNSILTIKLYHDFK